MILFLKLKFKGGKSPFVSGILDLSENVEYFNKIYMAENFMAKFHVAATGFSVRI